MTNGEPRARVALVTGGSRGIGKAIVRALGRAGGRVVLNHRSNEQAALDTVTQLTAEGLEVYARRADISDQAERQGLFDWIEQRFGGLDLLVNNAGITRDELFLMMRVDSWNRVLETNLSAAVACCELALPGMCRRGGGLIVNIGSGACFGPRMAQTNYAASKSGLLGYSRLLAQQVAALGVRVLLVAPGFTMTDMSAIVQTGRARESLEVIPLKRWGEPEEVAAVVEFVSSDAATYLTGAAFGVDGGRNAMEQDYGID